LFGQDQLIKGVLMKIYSQYGGNDLYLKTKIVNGRVKAIISMEDVFTLGSEIKIELTKKQMIMLANDLLTMSRR